MLNAEASVERQKPELSGFVDRYRPPHQCDPVSVPAAAVSCGVRAHSRSPLQAAVVIRRLLVHDDANVDPRIPAAAHVCRARGTQRRHVHVLSIETNKLPQLRQRQTASHRCFGPHLIRGFLTEHESVPKSVHLQFSHFCKATRVRNTQTMLHQDIATGRIYSRYMRCG